MEALRTFKKPTNCWRKLTKRIALGVEYNGARFHGWQKQRDGILSVQACLEEAISKVGNHPVRLTCAGRTDRGVHATRQVVHFDAEVSRPLKAWIFGSNAHLPADIGVKWSAEVSDAFNARFSALSRRYSYIIYNSRIRSALYQGLVTHEHRILDAFKMQAAGQYLIGENDFSSFRAANCQSNTPMRNIHHLRVTRSGKFVVVDVAANAFLHHMVRNIAGVLMDIGAGLQDIEWTRHLLAAGDRNLAGVTAAPEGLYLVDVQYPAKFDLPAGPDLPSFVTGVAI